jgi:hypothetical protein
MDVKAATIDDAHDSVSFPPLKLIAGPPISRDQ